MKNNILRILAFFFFTSVSSSISAYELTVMAMFRDEANYLKEWVEYHHLIGVDHFILYNDRSDDNWEEVLGPYISIGLVEVLDWHKDEATPLFPKWQVMAYQDALYRLKDRTKWMAFIDIDEFIVPMGEPTILKGLERHYSQASGVFICWRNFGTGGKYIKPGNLLINQLTIASDPLYPTNAVGKSIVKVNDVEIDQIWSPHQVPLKPGAQYYNGSGEPLYFEGVELVVDPQHNSKYFRINHYKMRDENFYQKSRLPRASLKEFEGNGELHLFKEQYESYNKVKDRVIIQFLKRFHPKKYKRFWGKR